MGYIVRYQDNEEYKKLNERTKFLFDSMFIYMAYKNVLKQSNQRLSIMLGVSVKVIEKTLKELDDAKLIERECKKEKEWDSENGKDVYKVVDRKISLNSETFRKIVKAKDEKELADALSFYFAPIEYTWRE